MKEFILTLLITAGVAVAVIVVMERTGIILEFPTYLGEIIAFLTATTAILFRFVFRAGPGLFVQTYLLTMVVKLLGYGAFIFFVIVRDRQNAIPNVVTFLIGYLLFTGIEIFYLHRKTRG